MGTDCFAALAMPVTILQADKIATGARQDSDHVCQSGSEGLPQKYQTVAPTPAGPSVPWAVGRLCLNDFKSRRAYKASDLQSRIFIGSFKSIEDRMGPGFRDCIVLALNRHHAIPVCAPPPNAAACPQFRRNTSVSKVLLLWQKDIADSLYKATFGSR